MKRLLLSVLMAFCCIYCDASLSFRRFINLPWSEGCICVRDMVQTPDGQMWLAAENGLYSYDGYHLEKYDILDSQREISKMRTGSFNRMILDADSLIIGCNAGVLSFNLGTQDFNFLPYARNEIVTGLEMVHGNLWVSTNEGLYQNGEKLRIGLSDIICIEGDEDYIYIGTMNSVKRYSLENENLEDLPGAWGYVSTILSDKSRLWVGTGERLICLSKNDGSILESYPMAVVKKIEIINDELLAGTDDGLYLVNISAGQKYRLVHDARDSESLLGDVIWSILKDKDENIWFGTDAGISIASSNDFIKTYFLPAITGQGSGNTFSCVHIDNMGRFWLGGNSGLIVIENLDTGLMKYRWYTIRDKNYRLPHNRVRCIAQLDDGLILVGGDMGVLLYDEQSMQFNRLPLKKDSNKSEWVYSIRELTDGNILITTFTEDYEVSFDRENSEFNIIGVSAKSGLDADRIFKDSVLNVYGVQENYMAVFKDSITGRILLGGRDRFAMIDGNMTENYSAKKPRFIGLRVDNRLHIPCAGNVPSRIVLPTNTKFVEIMFSDYDYIRLSNEKYNYRIDNGEWIPLKRNDGSVIITDIGYGTHYFELSKNGDFSNPVGLEFTIESPWYISTFAIAIYSGIGMFLILLICYLFDQRKIVKIERQENKNKFEQVKEIEKRLSNENRHLLTQLKLRLQEKTEDNYLNDDEKFLQKITFLIDEHMSDFDFNVNTLSELSNISNKSLYRKIKSLTGMTAVAYIRDQRMKKAASLLSKGGFTVSEVMYKVGFTNPSYFSRCFQDIYGVSPSEYNG